MNIYKKLAKYDQWHFAEVDPVFLRRTALTLREQILQKIERDDDPYLFYSRTLPVLEAAIRGEIVKSLDEERSGFISRNYYHAKSEGTLSPRYDHEFTSAVSHFSVAAEALSLEHSETVVVDGVTYKWRKFEEEGDWPDEIKYR